MGTPFKLFSAAVAIVIFGLTVAACGGGSDNTGSVAETGGNTSTSEASSDICGTIEVWDTEYKALPKYTEAIKQLDSEFEKQNPCAKVTRVAQPFETYEQLYRAAFTAHEGPDIMTFQPGVSPSFKEGLVDIAEKVSPGFLDGMSMLEFSSPGRSLDGEYFAIPVGIAGFNFYFNKELFKKAGLPTDFQPESWDELREAGEKLRQAGIQPFAAGDKEGLEGPWLMGIGLEETTTPEQIVQLALGEIPYTSKSVSEAFAPAIKLQEAGLYSDNRFTSPYFTSAIPEFSEAKAAMFLGFWNTVGYWGEFNPELGEKNVGIFFRPGDEDPIGVFPAFEYSITGFAKNPDGALALLEFETGKAGMETLVGVGQLMPNRAGIELPSSFPSQPKELLAASRKRGTRPYPETLLPASVTKGPMLSELTQVLQGRTSIEDAQKAMQEVADREG